MHRDPQATVKTNAALMARRRAALPSGLGQTYDVVADHAENAEVWDVEGKRYPLERVYCDPTVGEPEIK